MTPEQRYIARFLRKSGIDPRGAVLDLGCGNGTLAVELARHADSLVGVDVAEQPEWASLTSERTRFAVGDAERLDFADASFDSVLAINMLHHTSSPERAIAEMVRVARPGGRVTIVEPNRYNPLGYVHLTLMGDHQHFPNTQFLEFARRGLGSFELRQFECHCYPFPAALITLLEKVEDALDVIPLWHPFLFYNVVSALVAE